MNDRLPQGYDLNTVPADYTGKLWIEGQMRYFAAAVSAADHVSLMERVVELEKELNTAKRHFVCRAALEMVK